MENPSSEEINDLKEELKVAKEQLQIERNEQYVTQINPQDKFIEVLFDKGSGVFNQWLLTQSETEKLAIEKENEYNKENLKVIEKIDKRDKNYKGIMLTICLMVLAILAFYDKSATVAPVIGVVIGLLLKSNSISDYLNTSKKAEQNEEE